MNACPCNYLHVSLRSVSNAAETRGGSQWERLVSTSKRQENVIIQRVQQTEFLIGAELPLSMSDSNLYYFTFTSVKKLLCSVLQNV